MEIIRGPGSALYGSNAFMAVINIVTMKAEDIKGLQVTAGGGSFDTQHYNLLFGHEGNKLKISGHFDYLDTAGPSSHIEQDAIGNSGDTLFGQERPDAGFNISYGDFTLRGRYMNRKTGPYIGAGHALNDETLLEWEQGYIYLVYNRSITDNMVITARIYADHFKLDHYWELYPEGFVFPSTGWIYPDGMIGNPISKQRTFGSEIATDYKFSDHLLTTGILYEDIKQYDVKSINNFNPDTYAPLGPLQDVSDWGNFNRDADRDVWALYMQDIWNITDEASLTAGIRYDNYSDFGETVIPRAGFVWEFMKNTSVKLLYGTAFRAPGFYELYHQHNPVVVGEPDLKPEGITTYEAGLEHRFLDRYTVKLNYFYNDLTDLIVIGDKPSETEPAQYENRDRAEVQGVELELLSDFGNDHYGYLNYSYQDPRDGDTDERLADVPSHRANAGINLAPWRYLNANVNVSWTGKRPRAEGDTRDDLASSTLVGLTLIAKKFYNTLEIRGSVYNLFNEDYLDPSPFNPDNPVTTPVPNDYPTNERMFLLEARYTF